MNTTYDLTRRRIHAGYDQSGIAFTKPIVVLRTFSLERGDIRSLDHGTCSPGCDLADQIADKSNIGRCSGRSTGIGPYEFESPIVRGYRLYRCDVAVTQLIDCQFSNPPICLVIPYLCVGRKELLQEPQVSDGITTATDDLPVLARRTPRRL